MSQGSLLPSGRALVLGAIAAAVLVATPGVSGSASAQTITATALGSDPPPTGPSNQPIQNGDFLIAANPPAPLTGDGIDEQNTWTFDFTTDPNFPTFPTATPLASAKLTLTLRPGNGGIITDLVGITDPTFTSFVGPGPVITPVIQGLPVGVQSTIVIELLNTYSSADILGAFVANGGHLPMLYHDDVVLSFAKLELVAQGHEVRPVRCGSLVTRIMSVTRPHFTPTMVDFQASGGNLDPTPLLQTSVSVVGAGRSCLVVNFSTMALPRDNHVLFQVRVDGVPMQGHIVGFAGFATPVVADPEETDQNQARMVAYTFFQEVDPGPHTVQVFFAGCCSLAPPAVPLAYAGSPVLAVHYR